MIGGMKGLTLLTILALVPAVFASDEEFRAIRRSLDVSFRSGSPEDRLASVRSMSTFGHEDSTRVLVSTIPLAQARVDEIIALRKKARGGRDRSMTKAFLHDLKVRLD